jgi:hypothetical protein
MSKLSTAASHYREVNSKFMRDHAIPESATLMVGPVTASVVDDHGKGITGDALLLGSVTEVATGFLWKWGWKYTNFDSPIIDKSRMVKAFGLDAKKFGIERGSIVLHNPAAEETIRGVCMREYNLVYITEFSGHSESFIIGFTNATEYTLDAITTAALSEAMQAVSDREVDPVKLEKLNLKLHYVKEE